MDKVDKGIQEIEDMDLEEGENVVVPLDVNEVLDNKDIYLQEFGSVVTSSEASKEVECNRVVVAVEVNREDVRKVETEEQCGNDDIRNVVVTSSYHHY